MDAQIFEKLWGAREERFGGLAAINAEEESGKAGGNENTEAALPGREPPTGLSC